MAWRLAAVPEESMGCSTAAYPPRGIYLDWIRTVAVSGAQIRSTTFSQSHSQSQSDYSGSSYSSASNSHLSSNSGCSSGSASAVAFGGQEELKRIARLMVSDGYTQRMAQAFHATSPAQGLGLGNGGDPDSVLETWFSDLDVGWVLQTRQEHGSLRQLRIHDQSASFLQDLVERWIRGLTVIVQSMLEMVSTRHEMVAVARLGKASISKMLVFVDAFLSDLKAEKLQAVLDMYICVSSASYMFTLDVMSAEAQGMFNETSGSLSSGRDRLKEAIISGTMEEMRKVMDDGDDGLWAIEIKHGGGGIHKKTRLGVNFIMSLFKAAGGQNSPKRPVYLGGLVNDMINYLQGLLCRKSELCTDLSLRYLFLLNNCHFVTQECDSCFSLDTMMLVWPERFTSLYGLTHNLTSECNQYMASYLDASWGHVLSSIPRSHFPGPIHRWIYTSSLTKFESAFRQTYQAQKFWKVPDPRLRDALRRVITERVISSYRDYLKEHPELAEHVNRGSRSPDVLEGLLGELFEG